MIAPPLPVAERARCHAQWEFYERGGWKPILPYLNDFLEEQYLLSVDTCATNIDMDIVLEWNFPSLRQQCKHFYDDAWHVVEARAIRCIYVLAGPAQPRG